MQIRDDILGAKPEQRRGGGIKADFFYSHEMYVPGEERRAERAELPAENWRAVVNRGLMKGLTADQIRKSFRDKGVSLTEEMNAYLDKYEGLIGPVFIDCSVLRAGFPLSSVPRSFEPYRMFCINCDDTVLKRERHVEGGFSGELDAFLDASGDVKEKVIEVCRVTGLPVLKKGMFTEETVDLLLAKLGRPDLHGMDALRDELKRRLLGVEPVGEDEAVKAEEDAPEALKYNLKAGALDIRLSEPVVKKPDLEVGFRRPSGKVDLEFNDAEKPELPVSVDGSLRF